jgi:hypothetical protein
LDIDMSNSHVLHMPVKLGLKLMTFIRPYCVDGKGKSLGDIVDEINGVSPGVLLVDLDSADANGMVDSCILKPFDLSALASN